MGPHHSKMPKGSGMSGASQNVARGGTGGAGAIAKGARNAGGGAQKERRVKSAQSAGGAMIGNQDQTGGILRFYTHDAPGLKIGLVTVLVSSLVYIGCVVLLHIWGKLTR